MFSFFAWCAPGAESEFAFLVMLTIGAALSRQLGACYLVGAFVVSIMARRLRAPAGLDR
jgi:hypothetical protein